MFATSWTSQRNNSTGKKRSCIENEIGDGETTWLSYLQKLRNWGKSISSLPENIDFQDVKRFLIGSGFKDEEVKKCKTLRSWEHKQGVHSLRYTCLLMGHYSYCKIKFGSMIYEYYATITYLCFIQGILCSDTVQNFVFRLLKFGDV